MLAHLEVISWWALSKHNILGRSFGEHANEAAICIKLDSSNSQTNKRKTCFGYVKVQRSPSAIVAIAVEFEGIQHATELHTLIENRCYLRRSHRWFNQDYKQFRLDLIVDSSSGLGADINLIRESAFQRSNTIERKRLSEPGLGPQRTAIDWIGADTVKGERSICNIARSMNY